MKLNEATFRILISTRRPFLYSLGIGLVSCILVFVVMIPQIQDTISLFGKLNAETPKTEKLKQKLAALESIVNTAEYAQIDIVEDALPSKKPLLELLTSLYMVSTKTNVAIQQFKLSPGLVASDSTAQTAAPKRNNNAYDSLELTIQLSGTFQQIQDFLLQVEKAAPFTTVTKMDIGGEIATGSDLTKENRVFKADLVTKTFFFTQAISVRVETPLPLLDVKEQNVLAALASFIPNTLSEQTTIQGGGQEDPFGVPGFAGAGKVEYLEQLLTSEGGIKIDPALLQSQGSSAVNASSSAAPIR